MNDETQKVQQIAQAALGTTEGQLTFLGRGATSTAWRVDIGNDAFIVRFIPSGTKRPVTYQSEFTILRLLREQGSAVSKPLLNSAEYQQLLPNVPDPWAVTSLIDGQPILKERLSQQAARELGKMLATVHGLPIARFGRLAEQPGGLCAPGSLCGLQSDPLAGVGARWCHATLWPLEGLSLADHPISALLPELVNHLEQQATGIFETITSGNAVLTHSDLHGEHIFVKKDRLAGIIDFGAAFIGHPAWDFASLAFYHGWETVQSVLEGYCSPEEQQTGQPTDYLDATRKLSLAVSLYKLDKAVAAHSPSAKIQRITAFIKETYLLDKVRTDIFWEASGLGTSLAREASRKVSPLLIEKVQETLLEEK